MNPSPNATYYAARRKFLGVWALCLGLMLLPLAGEYYFGGYTAHPTRLFAIVWVVWGGMCLAALLTYLRAHPLPPRVG